MRHANGPCFNPYKLNIMLRPEGERARCGGALTRFRDDLEEVLREIKSRVGKAEYVKLLTLKDRLVEMHDRNLVKINHSVMELISAMHLVVSGFDVEVEHELEKVSCDVYAVKGFGSVIVEVETGFVPPEHALNPATYCKARIASKITRYGNYSDKFALGVPPYYILQIPPALTKPPRYRRPKELEEIKNYCDLYYKNPPVSLEEIRNARLHAVYIIDVNGTAVKEIDPDTYIENMIYWSY